MRGGKHYACRHPCFSTYQCASGHFEVICQSVMSRNISRCEEWFESVALKQVIDINQSFQPWIKTYVRNVTNKLHSCVLFWNYSDFRMKNSDSSCYEKPMKKKSKFETGIPAFANTLLKKQEFDFIVFLFHGKILDCNCGSCTINFNFRKARTCVRTIKIWINIFLECPLEALQVVECKVLAYLKGAFYFKKAYFHVFMYN